MGAGAGSRNVGDWRMSVLNDWETGIWWLLGDQREDENDEFCAVGISLVLGHESGFFDWDGDRYRSHEFSVNVGKYGFSLKIRGKKL